MALPQLNSILCPDIAGYVNQFMNLVMATQQEIEADPNHVMAVMREYFQLTEMLVDVGVSI